jgi:hypothetical protein
VFDERLRLGEAVLPGRRVEHEQHLGDGFEFLDHPTHLGELIHQAALGLQPAGGVDEHDLDALGPRLLDGLEGDGCRVLPGGLRSHDGCPAALRPGGELLDGGGAEGVGGPDDHGAPVVGEELRELADRRRLADAVDADDKHDRGPVREREGRVEASEPFLDRLAQHPLEVGRIGRAVLRDLAAQLVDDRVGQVGPEVRRDEGVFEVIPGVVVDRRPREHASQGRPERPRRRHATMFARGW